MFSIVGCARVSRAVCLLLLAGVAIARAQSLPGISVPAAPHLVTEPINERALAPLPGNVHPLAQVRYDRGRVPDSFPQNHTLMLLKRSPQQEGALEEFMREQYDPHSQNFHRWLTPAEFGSLFGPSTDDIGQVTGWLSQHGFTVNRVAAGRTFIDFSGTAGQIAAAFHTEIHYYQINGKQHYANAGEPMIPAALAPLVSGFRALNDFYPHPMSTKPGVAHLDKSTGRWSRLTSGSQLTDGSGTSATYLVGPQDLAQIYGLNQVWSQSVTVDGTQEKLVGTGETIGVVGDTVLNTTDLTTFRNEFGLNNVGPGGSVVIDNPPSSVCAAPNSNSNNAEGYIDVEWAGATAPGATIDFVACANSNTDGADLAATYIVEDATHAAQDPVLSSSYGYCEEEPLSDPDQFYVSLWQQAAAEGITVLVSSGDGGSAECDDAGYNDYADQGLAVNAEASTPYNVAVGGTDFSDVFSGTTSNYWSAVNGSSLGSALSYIPETTWNDSCASPLVFEYFGQGYSSSSGPGGFCTYASQLPVDPGTGYPPYFNNLGGNGGLSTVSARPSWQIGVAGIPAGAARAVPDVSLFAASGITWGHALLFCDSAELPTGLTCDFSDPNNLYDSEAGGTSFSAPAFAGIMALIDQKSGGRQGQADNILYPLAAQQYVAGNGSGPSLANCAAYLGTTAASSCYFHDISGTPNPNPATQAATPFYIGNNSVPCTGSATAPGTYTDSSSNPASNYENCYGYEISVTQNGSSLTSTPSYYGVESTADNASSPAYPATPGYDLATGLGSPNVAALVNASGWSSLSITTSSLPAGAVGTAYSQTLLASGGIPPYTWRIASGSLPAGLSLNSSTGVISGTPTLAVSSTFVVEVEDSESTPEVAQASFTLGVPGLGVSLNTSSVTIPFGSSGTLAITLTPEGGFTGPVTLSCGSLPAHLACSFSPSSPVTFTANSGAVTEMVTINTAVVAAAVRPMGHTGAGPALGLLTATALWMPAGFAGLLGFGGRKKNKLKNGIGQSLALVALFVAGLAALAALGGCAGSPTKTTPDGAYSVTVNVGYAGGSQSLNATVLIE